jgi:hypothetical protein
MNMKNLNHSKYLLLPLILAACGGPGSKTPVSDIDQIRAKSQAQTDAGNLPGAPRNVPEYVVREKEVIKEQATLNESYIKVEIDKKDSPLVFFEGRTSSAKIYLRILDPSVKMTLTAKDLPQGATLQDVSTVNEPNTYQLKWTPALYTIAAGEDAPKIMSLTLVPVVDASRTPANKLALIQKMFLDKVFTFSVFRTQEKAYELQISGLNSTTNEGQLDTFSVTVRMPGVDDHSPQKPSIGAFKDNVNQVAGTNYMEMDGSKYVDLTQANVEYLGDFKWRFNNLIIDTKSKPVDAQKAKDGSIVANSDVTHVRFALKVYGPYTATNATVVQIAIKRDLPPAAPAVETPAAPKAPDTDKPVNKSQPKKTTPPKKKA